MNTPSEIAPTSRRHFLAQVALAGAALPLVQLPTTGHAAEPKKSKKTKEPATSSAPPRSGPTTIHVFAKPLQWLSYDGAAKLIADTGFGGIDYAVRVGGHVLPEKVQEDLPRAIEAARKAGLKVEMITTDITDARGQNTEIMVKTAAKLGVKCYRFGNFKYDDKLGITESLQKLKPVFKELADLNRAHGIHGAIQNHAGIRVGAPLWDSYELLKDLDPRWIGVQYDIRHATAEGGQSWPLALQLIHRWVRCTDLKDFKWMQSPGKATIENVPIGQGIVNFDQYFKLVRDLGIGGPMSVHLEYPPFERATKQMSETEKLKEFATYMRNDLQALKGYMAKQQLT